MKKVFALLLAWMLAVFSAGALAAPGDAELLRSGEDGFDGGVRCVSELEGSLYVLGYDAVYLLASDGAQPVRYPLNSYPAPEEDGDAFQYEYHALCPVDGRMCVAVTSSRQRTEGSGEDADTLVTLEGAYLCELALSEADGASPGERIAQLDWRELIAGDGDFEYINAIRFPFAQDGALCFLGLDEAQNALLARTDLQSGKTEALPVAELLDPQQSVNGLCPYRDGKWLMLCTAWAGEQMEAALYSVDMDAGRAEKLCALPAADAEAFGIAYREDADTLYYCSQGELRAAPGLDVEGAQAVCAISANSCEVVPVVTAQGMYILADGECLVRRNTDPALRAQRRLTIHNGHSATLDSAIRAFSQTHGEVEVRLVDSTEEIVQAMMNRSDSVDVYCVSTSSPQYDAVFSRGYMAELGRSDKLCALMESFYPFAQAVCMREGAPVAVPVWMYLSGGCGYSPEALEALGMTADELPKTWAEFFAALEPLAARAAQQPGMSLFDAGMDKDGLRYDLFSSMMSEYVAHISQPGSEFAFDTPMFRALLAAFEGVDWDALGLADSDEQDELQQAAQGETKALFYNYCDASASRSEGGTRTEPLMLRLDKDVEPLMQAELTLAFLNPYSDNPEDAVAFLESVADNMEPLMRIHLSPQCDEPVRSASYEASLADYDRQISTLEGQLESAGADEKAAYEEMLAQAREEREEFLRVGAWEATQESIARYRRFAPCVVAVRNAGISGESAEVFFTQQSQYIEGLITAQEMIHAIDGKLQMMVREGM